MGEAGAIVFGGGEDAGLEELTGPFEFALRELGAGARLLNPGL